MQNKKTKYNKSQNESLQNSESSPEFLEKRPAPQGQIPSPPTPRAPPRWESSSFAVSKCQATQLEGVSPGCTMQSSMVLVKTKEPGHLHWRAKVVAKENSDFQGWLLVTCSGFYSPSPLTGLIVMFVPCLNSSLEFILVTGLRFEILTPSFAFLLCGLKNTPVIAILKCSKVVISILPPCLSRMCFHKGLSAVFLWTSAMWSSPLEKQFFPVSPAYSLLTVSSHRLQVILYPTPVFLQIPSCPVLQGKHIWRPQFFLLLAPGTEVPSNCPNCLPPLSWTDRLILEPLNSSSHTFFRALAKLDSGVGGTMMTPSLMFVPRFSFLIICNPEHDARDCILYTGPVLQAHMPYESSENLSNKPNGPMGFPQRACWPLCAPCGRPSASRNMSLDTCSALQII